MNILVLGGRLAMRIAHYAANPGLDEVYTLGKQDLDITDDVAVMKTVAGVTSATGQRKPNVVVNCAAKTNVSAAEANRSEVLAVNALAAGSLALACRAVDVPLVHISTDFVFRGDTGPSTVSRPPYPVNAYGISKLWGERAVQALSPEATIVRLGWLYGHEYPQSAPMLCETQSYTETTRTGEQVRHRPSIISDFYGNPTFVGHAAKQIALRLPDVIQGRYPGIRHLSSGEEPVSWYDLLSPVYPDIVPVEGDRIFRPVPRPRWGGLVPSEGWIIPNHRKGLDACRSEVKTLVMAL